MCLVGAVYGLDSDYASQYTALRALSWLDMLLAVSIWRASVSREYLLWYMLCKEACVLKVIRPYELLWIFTEPMIVIMYVCKWTVVLTVGRIARLVQGSLLYMITTSYGVMTNFAR